MSKMITLMVACMMISIAVAAEPDTGKREALESRPPMPTRARGQSRGPQQRQRAYEQMLAKRAERHAKAIAELAAIKKIAEEEGATRTAAAIQKMIDQKNLEYNESATRLEQQRRTRAEQIQRNQAGEKPAEKADNQKKPEKDDE